MTDIQSNHSRVSSTYISSCVSLYCKVWVGSWTVCGIISKDSAPFVHGPICLVSPDISDYETVSQIINIVFSLGIKRGNIKLIQKNGNLEVQILWV